MILPFLTEISHSLVCSALLVTTPVLKILSSEITVFIQRFPMSQDNSVPGMGVYLEFHISGQILPIVNDRLPIGRLKDFSLKALHLRNWYTVGAAKGLHTEILYLYHVIIGNLLHPRINHLALLHVVFPNRARLRSFPAFIRNADYFPIYFQLKI